MLTHRILALRAGRCDDLRYAVKKRFDEYAADPSLNHPDPQASHVFGFGFIQVRR